MGLKRENCSLRTSRMKGVLLTILLGVGLYVLRQLFIIVFHNTVELLANNFGVEIVGPILVLAIMWGLAIDIGSMIAALATGKYLLTRLRPATGSGEMRSIRAILLLGLGLVFLRYVSLFLFVNLTSIAWSRFVDNDIETMVRFLDITTTAIDVGFLIAGVALGKHLLGREREEGAEVRQHAG